MKEPNEEITLKELIFIFQDYFREIVKNWKIIAVMILFGALFMILRAWLSPVSYPAALTFMVNENDDGGGASAILAQFGLGGGKGGRSHNLNKILALSKTRKIIREVLFVKKEILGENDYIANHLIRKYDYHGTWDEEEKEELKNFLFNHTAFNQFTKLENLVLKILHGLIIGNEDNPGIIVSNFNEETGIMKIVANTKSEELSIYLAEIVFEKLSVFYIDQTIEKQKKTYEVVKSKADSLGKALNRTTANILQFDDTHFALTKKKYTSERMRLEQDLQKLQVAYAEVYKNLEIADFSLKNSTPYVQIIDRPIPPIKPKKEKKLIALILGCILGVGLGVTFILGRKIVKDALS
jgi:hypothetical protein